MKANPQNMGRAAAMKPAAPTRPTPGKPKLPAKMPNLDKIAAKLPKMPGKIRKGIR